MMSEKKQKIDSLQALRAIAFLGIFFLHSNFVIEWATLGVSVFFVMSGFLLMTKNSDKTMSISLKDSILFSLRKIKRLYPLHVITTIGTVVLFIENYKGLENSELLRQLGIIVLHLTLTQTWVPNANFNTALNGVSWYLCVALFLYFMFPYLSRLVNKCKNWMLYFGIILVLLVEVILCIIIIHYKGAGDYTYIWFVYCFPLFRFGDFIVGACAGKIFTNSNTEWKCKIGTVVELLAVCITIVVIWWNKQSHDNLVAVAFNNWTTVFIPLSVIWVYVFAAKQGYITKILSNRLLIFLGNISAYLFLIHYFVLNCANKYISIKGISIADNSRNYLILIELLISIVLSVLYKMLDDFVAKKKSDRR